jgi:hypothetical protein
MWCGIRHGFCREAVNHLVGEPIGSDFRQLNLPEEGTLHSMVSSSHAKLMFESRNQFNTLLTPFNTLLKSTGVFNT